MKLLSNMSRLYKNTSFFCENDHFPCGLPYLLVLDKKACLKLSLACTTYCLNNNLTNRIRGKVTSIEITRVEIKGDKLRSDQGRIRIENLVKC